MQKATIRNYLILHPKGNIKLQYRNDLLEEFAGETLLDDFARLSLLEKLPVKHYEFEGFKKWLLENGYILVSSPKTDEQEAPRAAIIGEGEE